MAASPQHFTLTANVEKTFTFDDNGAQWLEVTNVDGAATVYFTTNNTAATVSGDGCHVLPATICSLELREGGPVDASTIVRCISSGTPAVSVRVW